MRANALLTSVLYSCAFVVGHVRADDQAVFEEAATESFTSVAESSTSSIIEKPTFTPFSVKAPFFEQFTDDWSSRWAPSHAKKENSKTDEEWVYVGEWAVEEPNVLQGIIGDKGLVVKNPAAHHAISAKFDKKIDNKGKTLVVQYEVKLQNGLECGGAYLKLLQDNKALHAEEFSNASPYIIMFGPDKCGSTNKVHFIFRHKHPKTGEYEEKHLISAPLARIEKLTTLYTLIIKQDQTFSIQVNGESVKDGSLFEDFHPSVNPDKEIDDANDSKPVDWVDQAKIADPEATKPEDWDEDAPFEILDEEATKPADWLDDEPATVPDPEAEKPEDWEDDEDGDWVPPTVPNPKCEEASGCGEWQQPKKKNPDYKGKWNAPLIDNPEYKGVWKARKIKNPDYFEDKTPANLEPMGAIGFEIWTMQNNILFDNIYIGHSIEDAAKLKAATYDIKHPIEESEDEATKPKVSDSPKSPSDLKFLDDPILYVREKVQLFLTIAQKDPIQAVKFVPEVAGGIGVLIVTLIAVIIGALGTSGATAPPQVKKAVEGAKENLLAAKDKVAEAATSPQVKKAVESAQESLVVAKDRVTEAATSGAEKIQAEANKRTTRSSGPVEY